MLQLGPLKVIFANGQKVWSSSKLAMNEDVLLTENAALA
jgi:hypothetical protein